MRSHSLVLSCLAVLASISSVIRAAEPLPSESQRGPRALATPAAVAAPQNQAGAARPADQKVPRTAIGQGSPAILAQQIANFRNGVGRGQIGGGRNGQGNLLNDDLGPQLVDVIQSTVAPSTWRVNGGVGVVHYYRQGRALVVAAPQQTHEQLLDVIGQLRRAQ